MLSVQKESGSCSAAVDLPLGVANLATFFAISGDFPDPLGDLISKKRLATNLATFFCHLVDYCVDKALKKHLTYPVLQFTLQPISRELSTARAVIVSSPLTLRGQSD